MKIEVEVVGRETIRPSSPTPHHLKIFPLSGLDQYAASIYSPFYLFFPATEKHKLRGRLYRLKQSLAETLTHFYPLSGRISDNKHVICNDEGINFFEARISGGGHKLSQFLAIPQPEELQKLLSRDDELLVCQTKALLSVQVSIFDCGGMAVGLVISHKVSDAFSDCLFLNFWAHVARADDHHQIHPPKIGIASIFPPKNIPAFFAQTGSPTGKIVCKMFLFSATNIAALEANIISTKNPSRQGAVIALIWRCASSAAARPENDSSVATLSVDLRPKQLVPQLSENSFGNCHVVTTTSIASLMAGTRQHELQDLLDKVRDSVKTVHSEYLKQLKAGDLPFLQPFREVSERCNKGEVDSYHFSGLCNFSFYETDFGWGKPIWVTSTAGAEYKNFVLLMDTKCGTGVEAWVTLDESHMLRFEAHPDIIAFTSGNYIALRSNM